MDNFSFLGNGDIGNFDNLFEQFRQDPESVDESWRRFFEGFEFFEDLWPHNSNMLFSKGSTKGPLLK